MLVSEGHLEFRHLEAADGPEMGRLFVALREAGNGEVFHPHPLTVREAERLCGYKGKDLYYGGFCRGEVVCYGMLRGWEEGYEVPSLGIAVHPEQRRIGLGRAFMQFLHCAAAMRGAARVRLKVYESNQTAVRLYERLGYIFEGCENGQLVGFVELWRG